MGVTMTKWEGPIFTGDKLIKGAFELDANPGSEKVTNGAFTGNATGWTLGAQWAYGSNAVAKSGAGTSTLSQDVSAVANEIYKVVYTTSGISGGSITVSIGGVSGTARTTNATFTEYITATGTGALTFTPASATAVTIDDVSVKRVGVAAADRVTAWVDDRGATAGKGALHIRTEDGTSHVFGDQAGIGTMEPSAKLQVSGVANEANSPILKLVDTSDNHTGMLAFKQNTDSYGFDLGLDTASGDGVWRRIVNSVYTEVFRVQRSTGNVLINATAAYADNGQLLEVNKSADDGGIGLFCWSTTDAERALLEFHKSSSATIGTKALVADEEAAGGIIWKVADGAVNWSPIASVEGFVDTAPGAGDTGGRLGFFTTADGASSVTEAMRINSAQKVSIGAFDPQAKLDIGVTAATFANYELHLGKNGQPVAAISGATAVAADGPVLILDRSRGTHASPTILSANDTLGTIYFNGYTDVSRNSVSIEAYAETGWAAGTDAPGRLVFKTSADGAASLTERLRIDNAGYMGLGTAASAATLFEMAEVKTITGAVTDGYSGGLTLDPGYTAATALTVTRHNYIDVNDVSNAGAGPSAVTDACVLRFDAAAGTHKATVGATTKTTPGGVDGWMKVNINGTIYYMPMYTSTTA